jgi:Outer membrane protein beta-barrel domain
MQKLLILFLIILSFSKINAQEDWLNSDTTKNELGLNITELINVILARDSKLSVGNYLLTYKYIQNYKGLRMGLRLNAVTKKSDFFDSQNRGNSSFVFDYRLGYEWQYPLANRWLYWIGIDGLIGYQYDKSTFSDNFGNNQTITDSGYNFGAGPSLGLQFHINKRMSLAFETSFYAKYGSGSRTFELDGNPISTPDLPYSSFDFKLVLPQTIFMILKL